tara:strand:- start:2300 stop:2902 length:603 start_codon:yes stop_codon:yes gene_type:complete
MARRCPPGVLCIENVTLVIISIIIVSILIYVKIKTPQQIAHPTEKIIIAQSEASGYDVRPGFGYSQQQNDVLMNPYTPPLRDDRVVMSTGPPAIPINIPTQSVDSTYRQVGILTRENGEEMILPLMGKPLFTNRDKWNFYTMSDKNAMIKLPVSNKNKSCTNEYGCDNIYNGDTVYVEGYNDAFKATIYDNNVMRYIPFL